MNEQNGIDASGKQMIHPVFSFISEGNCYESTGIASEPPFEVLLGLSKEGLQMRRHLRFTMQKCAKVFDGWQIETHGKAGT